MSQDVPNYEPAPEFIPDWLLDEEAASEPTAGSFEWTPFVHRSAPSEPATPTGLDVVSWADLYHGVSHEDAIVEGLLLRGRWIALVAAAKTGKSTFAIYIARCIAAGLDPLDGHPIDPVPVLYLDAEMGRVDMLDRLRDEMGLGPDQLQHLHYVDLVPKLNEPGGAAKVLEYVDAHGIDVVIVDGLNGSVVGAEKDDETWRPFYDLTVSELKRRSVSVVTCDNLGKDKSLGARGSSVKADKPDAVVQLERTDDGVRLKTTHRRTADYPQTLELTMAGGDGAGPVTYSRTGSSWPAGTAEKAAQLDQLAVPIGASTRGAKDALRQADLSIGSSDVLGGALRYRRTTGYLDRITPRITQNEPGPDHRADHP